MAQPKSAYLHQKFDKLPQKLVEFLSKPTGLVLNHTEGVYQITHSVYQIRPQGGMKSIGYATFG